VAPDSPWPPLRSLYEWALPQEPAHLAPPPNLIAAVPVRRLLLRARAPVRDDRARAAEVVARPLGLVYAGAAVTNMFFYFTQTFLGPHPPPNTAYYLVFNLPWLIAPAVLGVRVFFGRDLRTARG
jgi:hypothetical protein